MEVALTPQGDTNIYAIHPFPPHFFSWTMLCIMMPDLKTSWFDSRHMVAAVVFLPLEVFLLIPIHHFAHLVISQCCGPHADRQPQLTIPLTKDSHARRREKSGGDDGTQSDGDVRTMAWGRRLTINIPPHQSQQSRLVIVVTGGLIRHDPTCNLKVPSGGRAGTQFSARTPFFLPYPYLPPRN